MSHVWLQTEFVLSDQRQRGIGKERLTPVFLSRSNHVGNFVQAIEIGSTGELMVSEASIVSIKVLLFRSVALARRFMMLASSTRHRASSFWAAVSFKVLQLTSLK